MSDPRRRLDPAEVSAAGLDGWQADAGTLRARFRTGDFVTGLDLVNRVGAAAEALLVDSWGGPLLDRAPLLGGNH